MENEITDAVDPRLRKGIGSIVFVLIIVTGLLFLGSCKPPALRSDKETEDSSEVLFPRENTITVETPLEPEAMETAVGASSVPVVGEPNKKVYPLSRVITNSAGRSIPGEIVGKRGDDIAFKRTSDEKTFVVSLAQLSVDDQLDLAALPDESAGEVSALLAEQTLAVATTAIPSKPLSSTPMSRRAKWHDDPEEAFAESKALGLPVYVLFTGSDWCPPCKALERTIHNTSDFSDFADKNLVLLMLDFPKRKPQSAKVKERNREMASKWGVGGYPTIFLAREIDGSKEPVSRTPDVEGFLIGLESTIANLPQ